MSSEEHRNKKRRKLSNSPVDEVIPSMAIHNVNTQWGRLISCLPQLDSIDLVVPELVFGRSDECDIVFHKSKFLENQLIFVSKQHFLIARDMDDEFIVYIYDLSKNGTYVNDMLIGRNTKVLLQNNDTIALGNQLKMYIYKSMNCPVNENYLPQELKEKYVMSRLLGKGGCGEVRLIYDKRTCQKFALKKMLKGRDTPSQIYSINHPDRIQTEVNIFEALSHPLVVRMRDIVETEQDVFLVLEYMPGGELSSRLNCETKMKESQAKFYFYQMVLAVQYLHSNGITHRDLKPGNILLASSEEKTLLKVTDFGLSFLSFGYGDIMKTVCGTMTYIAPEVLNSTVDEYDSQVDIWSLGVILFYMLSKRLPFQSKDTSILAQLILHGDYCLDDSNWYEVSSSAMDLVKRMLQVDPHQRINIEQILDHPWIEKDHLVQYVVEQMLREEHKKSLSN